MLARLLPAKPYKGTRPITVLRPYSEKKNQQNQAIIEFLRRCQSEEEIRSSSNTFKVTAYKHAIRSISEVDKPIQLGTESGQLPGVGASISRKISEFLYASQATEKHPLLQEEVVSSRALAMLQTVPGIGPTTAKKLIAAGCTEISDLREPQYMGLLSKTQQIKVRYMGHLERDIAREDAEDVLNFISESLDPRYELALVGDYRRGSSAFPEIHLMVSHPDFIHIPLPTDPSPFSEPAISPTPKAKGRPKKRKKAEDKQPDPLHTDIVPLLQQRGLVADAFTSKLGSWEGVIRLPEERGQWGDRSDRVAGIENIEGRFRRIIINFVSHKCRGAALLNLTGDAEFTKHIASQAKQSGLLLNEHGLWQWNMNGSFVESFNDDVAKNADEDEDPTTGALNNGYWSLLKSATEREIFDELGTDYIDPTKRNFSFISGNLKKMGLRS